MFFFFNDTATTEIYTLSLHDALPISGRRWRRRDRRTPTSRPSCPAATRGCRACRRAPGRAPRTTSAATSTPPRSEEHTSELQSRQYLVCRLLLEKKKKIKTQMNEYTH